MRRVRRIRARGRGLAAGLLRPLRAPAPGPGVGRHRRLRGRPHHDRARRGPGLAGLRREQAPGPDRRHGARARALLHHRLVGVGERPAGLPLRPPPGGARPQRQPDQRGRAALRAVRPRRALPLHVRLGDHRRAALHARGGHDRGGGGRRAAASGGGVLHRGHDQRVGGRVPRPGRAAPAVAGPAGRPLCGGIGVVRVRHHRRRAGARGAARRDGLDRRAWHRHQAGGRRAAQGVLRLRAHLLRAPRLDPRGQPHPGLTAQDGRDPLARVAGGRRRGDRGARLRHARPPPGSPRHRACPATRAWSRTATWRAPSSSPATSCASTACG